MAYAKIEESVRIVSTITNITERKKANYELLETKQKAEASEARYELIANNTSDSIWVMDASLHFEYLSLSTEKLFGYTLTEWKTLDWNHFVHPDHMNKVLTSFGELKSGTITKIEPLTVLVRHKNGTEMWAEFSATGIFDENKILTGVVGITRDRTDSTLKDEALKKSEVKFKSLMQQSPFVVELYDLSGLQISVNKAYEELWNFPAETTLNKFNVLESKEVEATGLLEYVKRAYAGESITVPEYFFDPTGDTEAKGVGRRRWLNTRIYPLKDESEKVSNIVIVHQDVTERKEAEENLRESETRLRRIIEGSPVGYYLYTLGPDNRLVFSLYNSAADKILHINHEHFMGKDILEAFPALRGTAVPEMYRSVAKGELPPQYFEIPYNYDGIHGFYDVRVFQGGESQAVVNFTDISERKRMEEDLQKNQKLESLGVLAGGIAHDFNNLMGGIFGYIDLACETSKEEGVTLLLSNALSAMERARALTGQLLTFSKGGAPIQKVGSLFPFINETAKFALSGSSVMCSFDIQEDLWSCNFDKNQIGQVIDNLIINAQQAMPVGGTIELSARNITLSDKEHPRLRKGDYVRIAIKDTGIGIPKDLLARIFDPFFTTKEKGHGLGLSTCYSIINRHGGCIDVDSEPGKGSTFNIYLPASTEIAPHESPLIEKSHKGSGTFLIMDDEETLRKLMGAMLEKFGYSVVGKGNGKDAIEFFESETKANRKIEGMIFDLTVPGGMGGQAAIEEIRKMNRDIPAFVASGYADDPVMKNPEKYGFTASLCKPFRKSELAKILDEHMKISSRNT